MKVESSILMTGEREEEDEENREGKKKGEETEEEENGEGRQAVLAMEASGKKKRCSETERTE